MKIPEFQQVGVYNRETKTNCNDESSTFEEEREYREIKENMRIMSKFSSYFVSRFSSVNLSSCASSFSACLIQQAVAFPLSFCKINIFY